MEVINVLRSSKIVVNDRIHRYCGGRFTKKEAFDMGGIGIGGMTYMSGLEEIDNHRSPYQLKVNFETLKEGLGIYLRSSEDHYVILLRYEDILQAVVEKEEDQIRLSGFSIFKNLMQLGLGYHRSRIFLLDKEIIKYADAFLNISTIHAETLNFKINKKDPLDIYHYFEDILDGDKVENAIEGYRVE